MDRADLANRFTYHAPQGDQVERYQQIRNRAHELALFLNYKVEDCRELSLAITHLEQAVMWANAAIARHKQWLEAQPEND